MQIDVWTRGEWKRDRRRSSASWESLSHHPPHCCHHLLLTLDFLFPDVSFLCKTASVSLYYSAARQIEKVKCRFSCLHICSSRWPRTAHENKAPSKHRTLAITSFNGIRWCLIVTARPATEAKPTRTQINLITVSFCGRFHTFHRQRR